MIANLAEPEEDFKQITIIILWLCANFDLVMLHSLQNALRFSPTLNE